MWASPDGGLTCEAFKTLLASYTYLLHHGLPTCCFFFPSQISHLLPPPPPASLPRFPFSSERPSPLALWIGVVHYGVGHPLHPLPSLSSLIVRLFFSRLKHIFPTRISPALFARTAGFHHSTPPIQHRTLQPYYSLRQLPPRAPIMSSDDDIPLARTNGHCEYLTFILSCIAKAALSFALAPAEIPRYPEPQPSYLNLFDATAAFLGRI